MPTVHEAEHRAVQLAFAAGRASPPRAHTERGLSRRSNSSSSARPARTKAAPPPRVPYTSPFVLQAQKQARLRSATLTRAARATPTKAARATPKTEESDRATEAKRKSRRPLTHVNDRTRPAWDTDTNTPVLFDGQIPDKAMSDARRGSNSMGHERTRLANAGSSILSTGGICIPSHTAVRRVRMRNRSTSPFDERIVQKLLCVSSRSSSPAPSSVPVPIPARAAPTQIGEDPHASASAHTLSHSPRRVPLEAHAEMVSSAASMMRTFQSLALRQLSHPQCRRRKREHTCGTARVQGTAAALSPKVLVKNNASGVASVPATPPFSSASREELARTIIAKLQHVEELEQAALQRLQQLEQIPLNTDATQCTAPQSLSPVTPETGFDDALRAPHITQQFNIDTQLWDVVSQPSVAQSQQQAQTCRRKSTVVQPRLVALDHNAEQLMIGYTKDFRRNRMLRELRFRDRGYELCDIVDKLGDAILDDIVDEAAYEIEEFLEETATALLNQV